MFPDGEDSSRDRTARASHAPRLTPPQRPPIFAETRQIKEKMTKDTFGENLKREREMRGVSLDEISAATRIATRFLQAIENEQWDQLPGGVFNRGFVRAVARYLGLDEENIVAEYALAVGDRPSVPVWTGSPPAVTPDSLARLDPRGRRCRCADRRRLVRHAAISWHGARRDARRSSAAMSAAAPPATAGNCLPPARRWRLRANLLRTPRRVRFLPATPAPAQADSAAAAAVAPANPALLELKVEAGQENESDGGGRYRSDVSTEP